MLPQGVSAGCPKRGGNKVAGIPSTGGRWRHQRRGGRRGGSANVSWAEDRAGDLRFEMGLVRRAKAERVSHAKERRACGERTDGGGAARRG